MGAIVCKLDKHGESFRGYIAMLVVDKAYRKHAIGACSRPQQLSRPPSAHRAPTPQARSL